MAKHKKTSFVVHLLLTVVTGGGWLIVLGIWYFVKKA